MKSIMEIQKTGIDGSMKGKFIPQKKINLCYCGLPARKDLRNNRNYSKYCSREHMNLAHKFTASTKMDIKPSYKPVNYELYEQWKVWKNSNKKITQKKQDIFKILGVKRIC